MQDFIYNVVKSLVAIATLFLFARVMGKKQISQLNFFDYVVGISIGSIAASFAVEPDINYMHGMTSMVIFALFPILLSIISLKSHSARKLLDGKPSILIQHGNIIEENLKKSKLSINDLQEECRLKNAFNIQDIEYAIFETNGKLSVLMKPSLLPLTPQDMNLQTIGRGICTNLVVDGKLLRDNLTILNICESWLLAELSGMGVQDLAGVLLCTIDANRQIAVYEKNREERTTLIM